MPVYMADLGGRVVLFKRNQAIQLSATDPFANGHVVEQTSEASFDITLDDAREIVRCPRLLLDFLPVSVHFNATERQVAIQLLKGWLPSWARVPSSAEFRVAPHA